MCAQEEEQSTDVKKYFHELEQKWFPTGAVWACGVALPSFSGSLNLVCPAV